MFELLMTAIINGDKEETLRLLQLCPIASLPELLSNVDSKGYSLIHYLARYDDIKALHFLRDKVPAEMFTQSIHSWTPFMMAMYRNARDVVAYFEEENIDHFETVQEREAFYGAPISPGCDDTLLLSTRSPLYAGVAAGKLGSVETLLPTFLKIEVFSDGREKWLICFLYMFELAIENKHMHLLPCLVESIKISSLEEKLKWLMNDYEAPLSFGLNGSVLEYIENNYAEPANVIMSLFPHDDLELKKRLILSAAQKSCRKTLQGLLTNLSIAEKDRLNIIKELVIKVIEIYTTTQSKGAQFFSGPDILDVAAVCCAPVFNKCPDLLAILLFDRVIKNDIYIVDAFLKRLSTEAKSTLLSHQFSDGLTLAHHAAKHAAYKVLMMLSQHGLSFNLTDIAGVTGMQNACYQQNVYFRMVGKIVDGEKINQAIMKMLLNAVSEIRKINNTGQADDTANCIRGLFKALIALIRSDFGSNSQQLYRALSLEITKTIKEIDVFELAVFITMLEYGVMLQDYTTALDYFDRISAALKMVKPQEAYAGIYLPQMILAKLTLIFCQELNVEIPARTKVLLRQASANKVCQRWVNDEEGFGIQCPVSLLSFVNPQSLNTAILEKINDQFETFKKEVDNYIIHYAEVVLSDEWCQSASYQRMAKRLYADMMFFYNWWFSVEKLLCPEAFNIQQEGNQEKLKIIRKFLTIKSTILTFFVNAMKKESSEMAAQGVVELNKAESLLAEMDSALSVPDNKKEVEVAKPPINPLILWATEQGDSKTILCLLEEMDKRLLLQAYQEEVTTADYLAALFARKGRLEALKCLINKLTALDKTVGYQRLMTIAVEENQHEIVRYLGHAHFATPFHAQAYEGRWPADAAKSRASSMDLIGMVPLGYAVSGGDQISVERLQTITPEHAVAPEILLLRCLRARQLDLLPLLVSLIPPSALVLNLPKIFKETHKRFDKPLAALQEITTSVETKQLALVAMREGYADIMIELLRVCEDKDKRVEIACHLLFNIAYEYSEYNALQAICIRNEKIITENAAAKRIAQNSEDSAKESKRVNLNINGSDAIARLARFMANDFQDYPAQLNEVLRKFYSNGHDGGMRDLLLNLPLPVAAAAINYLPETKSLPPTLSLLHSAIVQNKSDFWYLLVTFGGNLLQKCHDKTEENLGDLIKSRYQQGISKCYLSSELLFAEVHLQDYCKLVNKLAQGETLSQDEIVLAVNQIKSDEIKLMSLDKYFPLLWATVRWCTAYHLTKTDFDSALRLARETMHAATGVTEDDYLRYAGLAFAVGDYHQASLYAQSLELALYQEYNLRETIIAQLGTTRLTLILLETLKIQMPAHISRFYLEKWDTLCEKQMIGEGFLPFITESPIVNVTILQEMLAAFTAYKTPEKNKSGKVYHDDDLVNDKTAILDINATNHALFDLIIKIETSLLASKLFTKEDKIKNTELLELFYKSANYINALLKKSWDALHIAYQAIKVKMKEEDKKGDQVKAPDLFMEFFGKVEKKVYDFTMALEEKDEMKSKKTDSAGTKKADKKTFNRETLTVDKAKAKPTCILGWGVRMTPQQLLELLPPLTHEEKPQEKPKQQTPKPDPKTASKKQSFSDRSTPKIIEVLESKKTQLQKRKRRNINISNPKDFPTLLSLRAEATSLTLVLQPQDEYHPPASPFDVIPRDIVDILRFFAAYDFNEFNAYLTGGAVRDALMGRPSQADYDITVHFQPEYLELILQRKFGIENVVRHGKGERKGDRHSWTVNYNGKKIDFSAEEQAQRDFTCNAIYWHPDIVEDNSDNSDGSHTIPGNLVYDPYGGLKDINDKILRPIHQDSEQIITNQALIFRTIRFKKQLGFELFKKFAQDIKNHRKEIEDIPKYVDRDLLIAQYQKMLKVFSVVELQKELEEHGLFKTMQARKIIQEEVVGQPQKSISLTITQ